MSRVSGTGVHNAEYVRPLGTSADGDFQVAVTTTASHPVPGWEHTRLRVATTVPGGHVEYDSGEEETLVVPLAGSFRVEVTEADGTTHTAVLPGRGSVFDGPTDVVYAGRGARLTVTSTGPDAGRVALCGAPAHKADAPKPYRHVTASDVPVELRGAGLASREVRNMGLPDVLDADSFLVCEVITPRATGARGRRTSTTRSAPARRQRSRRSTTSRPAPPIPAAPTPSATCGSTGRRRSGPSTSSPRCVR